MLVDDQLIEVKWNAKTKKHFEEKGYEFTKMKDSFLVKAKELSSGSKVKVKLKCDYCKEDFERQYTNYNRQKQESFLIGVEHTDACFKCYPTKAKTLPKNTMSTESELEIISLYSSGEFTLHEIMEKFSIKENKIYELLKKNEVPIKRIEWNANHSTILKEIYENENWESILYKLSPFKEGTITQKAMELGLSRKNIFSNEEVNILKNHYVESSYEELINMLPNRTIVAIKSKANKIGLRKKDRWEDNEVSQLKAIYPLYPNVELLDMFIGKSESSIASMAYLLKLKKLPEAYEYYRVKAKEELLEKLKSFAEELGRTPMQDDITKNPNMPGMVSYHRYFGSYVNACELLGLERNISNFGRNDVITSINGDICLSLSEKVVTDLLIVNGIEYEKEKYYKSIVPSSNQSSRTRCDWYINGIVVEYFGMFVDDENNPYHILADYYKKTKEKIKFCKDNSIPLIELYPEDLKDNCKNLKDKFKAYNINLYQKELVTT